MGGICVFPTHNDTVIKTPFTKVGGKEHLIPSQELEEIVDAADVDIVQDQESTGSKIPIDVEILQVRKRIRVRPVQQGKLKFVFEAMRGERSLSGAFHENYAVLAEKRRPADIRDAAAPFIGRKDRVMLDQMGQQQCAGAAAGFD